MNVSNNIYNNFVNNSKNYQKTLDLIIKCKEEIEKIKTDNNKNLNTNSNKELKIKNSKNIEQNIEFKEDISKIEENKEYEIQDHIIEIFEKRLLEFKNENEGNISGELTQLLNNFFNEFLLFENEENIDKKKKIEEFKKYNISEYVLEKIISFSEKHNIIIFSLFYPTPKEELEKMSVIIDYYIESNLISKIYNQIKNIFISLSEEVMNKIISVLNDKFNNEYDKKNDIELNIINEEEEKEKLQSEDILELNASKNIDKTNNNKEICKLLCILLSKNKLNESIALFIEILLKKLENNENFTKRDNKDNILKEIKEINKVVNDNIKKIILKQIEKCLHSISSCHDIDFYINNFYLTLDMIKEEISNYVYEKNIIQKEENIKNKDEIMSKQFFNDDGTDSNELEKIVIDEQKYFIENWSQYHLSKFDSELYKTWDILREVPNKYQNILNGFLKFDINTNCMKDVNIINKFPYDKINLIKEITNEDKTSDIKENLLHIKDGEKPEIKIKTIQTSLEIIKFSFELLKMFCIFHKNCYGNILENFTKIIILHLNFQVNQIIEGKCGFSVSQQEISMTNAIFLLIESIYEHIKNSDFFVTVAENSDHKIYDNYLDLSKNISDCCDLSKEKIEDLINNYCVNETFLKLQEIKLPYYNVVTGDVPVNEYALYYLNILKAIYDSMINCYDEQFIKKMINKALDNFFSKFEDYILHGKKIEDEKCLKQFKKDMSFLKRNLKFISIMDLKEIRDRIENINKSVLPISMRSKKNN